MRLVNLHSAVFLISTFGTLIAADSTTTLFNRLLKLKVRPSFNKAVSTYKNDILDMVAGLTPSKINTKGSQIAKQLNCDVLQMEKSLKVCAKESEEVKNFMNGQLRKAVAEEARLLTEKEKLERNQRDNYKELNGLKVLLSEANSKVNEAKQDFAKSVGELQRQHKKYRDAKNKCLSRRRRKRNIFGSISDGISHVTNVVSDGIHNTVGKPINSVLSAGESALCRAFNRDGIKNAKKARDLAREKLDHSEGRVTNLKTEVDRVADKMTNLRVQVFRLSRRLRSKAAETKRLSEKRSHLTTVSSKSKMLSLRVTEFRGTTQVLKDAVEFLVAFDDIMDPFRDISAHLKKFSVDVTGLSLSSATLTKIASNLRRLEKKLPNYPFVERVEGCS